MGFKGAGSRIEGGLGFGVSELMVEAIGVYTALDVRFLGLPPMDQPPNPKPKTLNPKPSILSLRPLECPSDSG